MTSRAQRRRNRSAARARRVWQRASDDQRKLITRGMALAAEVVRCVRVFQTLPRPPACVAHGCSPTPDWALMMRAWGDAAAIGHAVWINSDLVLIGPTRTSPACVFVEARIQSPLDAPPVDGPVCWWLNRVCIYQMVRCVRERELAVHLHRVLRVNDELGVCVLIAAYAMGTPDDEAQRCVFDTTRLSYWGYVDTVWV